MKELIKDTIGWNQNCWRYFQLNRFIDSLKEGTIYFAAANQFDDTFEGAVSLQSSIDTNHIPQRYSTMMDKAFQDLQRLTKINCWHKSDYENDAMWKLYAHDKKGIAITSTPKKMKLAIKPFKLKPEYCEEELYIGNVQYVDMTRQCIDNSDLNRFFYKHIIFSHENELRLVISLRVADESGVKVPEQGILVQVDYSQLINDIIIGPNISPVDKELLYNVTREIGLDVKLKESCLLYKPRFI